MTAQVGIVIGARCYINGQIRVRRMVDHDAKIRNAIRCIQSGRDQWRIRICYLENEARVSEKLETRYKFRIVQHRSKIAVPQVTVAYAERKWTAMQLIECRGKVWKLRKLTPPNSAPRSRDPTAQKAARVNWLCMASHPLR
jgi:hypothetical protein